jgi:hypothetical protein
MNLKLIIFCSLISVNAFSQHFGIKIGATVSSVRQNDIQRLVNGAPVTEKYWSETQQIPGLNVGIFGNFGKNKISIQPELQFTTKGFKNFDKLRRFQYITLPILIGYKIDPKVKVQLGPEIGYLLNKKNPFSTYAVDNFFVRDYSVVGGAEIELSKKASINLRYVFGLANIYQVPLFSLPKTMNTSIQASLHYAIF